MRSATLALMLMLAFPGPSPAQMRAAPAGLEGFAYTVETNGRDWWSMMDSGWAFYARKYADGPDSPPFAVVAQAEALALRGDTPSARLPVHNFGLRLEQRPESPGFSTNGSAGDLVLDPIGDGGDGGAVHVHTADCDGGKCPFDDPDASPDDDADASPDDGGSVEGRKARELAALIEWGRLAIVAAVVAIVFLAVLILGAVALSRFAAHLGSRQPG